jgi:hypothetical protein
MGIGIFSKDNSFSEFPTGRFATTFRNGSTAERPERWIGVTVEENPVAHFQFTSKYNGFEFTADRKVKRSALTSEQLAKAFERLGTSVNGLTLEWARDMSTFVQEGEKLWFFFYPCQSGLSGGTLTINVVYEDGTSKILGPFSWTS